MLLRTSFIVLTVLGPAAVGLSQTDGLPPETETETEEGTPVRLAPVIVTARKWTEEIQQVPQSVSVISGTLIEDAGLHSLRDASIYVPNMIFTEFSSRRLSFPYVRGVGSGQGDPAVTTYIDGVPQLSISSTNQALLDVDRIEFLRGPQGTLYGRNSVGGLIHVHSRRPSARPELRAAATIGNFGYQELSLRYSTPIKADELALSLSGLASTRDGYTRNTLTGNDVDTRESVQGRAQLLWTPDDANEIRISLHGEQSRDGGFVLSDLTGLRRNPHRIFQDFEGVAERDIVAPSVTWTHFGEMVEFSSVTSYQHFDIFESSDFDFTALDGVRRRTNEDLDAFVQEIRFASPADAPTAIGDTSLRWQAGALFFSSTSERSAENEFRPVGAPLLGVPAGTTGEFGEFDEFGLGLYGQLTFTLDRLDLGAGIRYDYEDKEVDIRRTFAPTGGAPVPTGASSLDRDWDEFLPRFSAAYHWTDDVTTYVLAARGFKAGGFNLSAPTGSESFDPETSWTYEGGIKLSLLDDRLLLNAAGFYIDWEDMQLSQFDAMNGGYVSNAGQSTSQGFELEVVTRPTEGLDLFGTFGYSDTEFDEFVDSFGADTRGNELPFAPDTTFSVGGQYGRPLGRDLEYYLRAEYVAIGSFHYDAGNIASEEYALTNFRAGIGGTNWRVEAWVRNAFNDAYVPVAFQPNPADATAFVGENGAPRTFGVTLSVEF